MTTEALNLGLAGFAGQFGEGDGGGGGNISLHRKI